MNKNKHLILDDRKNIQLMLDNKESFASIAAALGKDPQVFAGFGEVVPVETSEE